MKKLMQKTLIISSIIFSSSSALASPDSMETFLKEQGIVISLREEFKQTAQKLEPQGTNLDPLGKFVSSTLGIIKNSAKKEKQLVSVAKTFLGVPYKFGGNSSDEGLDCSALVKVVYEKAVGIILPRVAYEQAVNTRKISQQDLKPGDLVFFKTTKKKYSHVGIYVGNDSFIHAPRSGSAVRIENMNQKYWTSRFNGAHRVDESMLEKITEEVG